ncbi:hypothetical protein Tco_1124605 [Tanacetum coccineum]|uniref:Uncharacterized protein n=1 Tax=Tanacetum coccineum TaxID=301880 RepID=A0ABQ5J6P5_9ASTR
MFMMISELFGTSLAMSASHEQGGELIVYVSPLYSSECMSKNASLEQEKLAYLWNKYESHTKEAYLMKLGKATGYTAQASFECAQRTGQKYDVYLVAIYDETLYELGERDIQPQPQPRWLDHVKLTGYTERYSSLLGARDTEFKS